MRNQMDKIDEIMEKSNRTLLYAETQNNMESLLSPPPKEDTIQMQEESAVYNLKPECQMAIVKTLEEFQLLMKNKVDSDKTNVGGAMSLLDACLSYRQRAEFLGSSMRKLGALHDNLLQLQQNLEQQWEIAEEEDANDEEDKENTIADEF